MGFRQGDVSYLGPNNAKEGLEKIGESIYIKDVAEQIVHKAVTNSLKMHEGSDFQQYNYRPGEAWDKD